jgi:hypothetical protein
VTRNEKNIQKDIEEEIRIAGTGRKVHSRKGKSIKSRVRGGGGYVW